MAQIDHRVAALNQDGYVTNINAKPNNNAGEHIPVIAAKEFLWNDIRIYTFKDGSKIIVEQRPAAVDLGVVTGSFMLRLYCQQVDGNRSYLFMLDFRPKYSAINNMGSNIIQLDNYSLNSDTDLMGDRELLDCITKAIDKSLKYAVLKVE